MLYTNLPLLVLLHYFVTSSAKLAFLLVRLVPRDCPECRKCMKWVDVSSDYPKINHPSIQRRHDSVVPHE